MRRVDKELNTLSPQSLGRIAVAAATSGGVDQIAAAMFRYKVTAVLCDYRRSMRNLLQPGRTRDVMLAATNAGIRKMVNEARIAAEVAA